VKANKSDSGSGGGDKETEGEKVDNKWRGARWVVLAGCGQRGMGGEFASTGLIVLQDFVARLEKGKV